MQWDTQDEREPSATERRLRAALGIAVGIIAVGGIGLMVRSLMLAPDAPRHKVVEISLLKPPPPPPPPKPPEKPPEPQIKKPDEVKIQDKVEQAPKPAEAPPAQAVTSSIKGDGPGDIAYSATGGNGPGTVGGGGGNRLKFEWFKRRIASDFGEELNEVARLRTANYRVTARVWLNAQGRVERVELVNSTGNPEMDAHIREALAQARAKEAPPADLPQPVTIQLTSRGASGARGG